MVIENIVTKALLMFKILTSKNFSPGSGLLSSISKMKIFERIFDKFLIFVQFIQIDAIVGGYEAEKHRNALIKD